MIVAAILGALGSPVLAAPKVTFGVTDRTEIRLREPGDPVPNQAAPAKRAADVTLAPGAGLDIEYRRWSVFIGYGPRFTLRDFGGTPAPDLLNTGVLSVAHRWTHLTLTLTETASYGELPVAALAPTAAASPGTTGVPNIGGMPGGSPTGTPTMPGTPSGTPTTPGMPTGGTTTGGTSGSTGTSSLQGQPVPFQVKTVHYAGSETDLASNAVLTSRSTLGIGIGYLYTGGIDARSRQVLPLTSGPNIWARWGYDLRHHNLLTTSARAYEYRTKLEQTPGAQTPITSGETTVQTDVASAQESWTRQWGRRTTTTLAAGAGIAGTKGKHAFPFPVALASLTHGIRTGPRGAILSLSLSGSEDILVDRLTGLADVRGVLAGNAAWNLKRTTVYATASRSQSLEKANPNAFTLTMAGGGVRQEFARIFALDGGVTAFEQKFDQTPTTTAAVSAYSGLQWVAFVAFTITPKPWRL